MCLPGHLHPYLGYVWLQRGTVLIPFRLPKTSRFSQPYSFSNSHKPRDVGIWTSASVPPRADDRSSPTDSPVSPCSFVLPSFMCIYVFLSLVRVLLSALSWCSAGNSVSESVFLMYPRREMYHIHLLLRHLVLPSEISCF